ncbi:hypothetical protein LZ24_00428 [Desulfobotulus alkaliphilus]|uniref:Conjugal transfer protein TraB n=1 Tax=Desulfobotulus alkaliphilus TaxID=622671 RepID=A0A562S8P8_9BACT|nr:hypothetical protein [Desulfobotulus alkaliphilus]TWI76806.1 hypothetical protein LZ24_00428 [Desulfobotulus alkaliphilus]
MGSMDEQILRTTKEMVVKFIEVGRVSPTTFEDIFKNVYRTVCEAVEENSLQGEKKER